MQQPFVRILREHARERGGGRDARRAELDVGGLRRRGGLGLRAELLGDEAEHARALVLVEALALMPPAVEFEFLSHEPITSSGGREDTIPRLPPTCDRA